MINVRTVDVLKYKHFRAVCMVWHKQIHPQDLKVAFDELIAILDEQEDPICVVVDLRKNIYLPLSDTFKGALFGPHRHPNLATWLVMGENVFARGVADMLNRFSDQQKIQWFNSQEAVDEFLEENCPDI